MKKFMIFLIGIGIIVMIITGVYLKCRMLINETKMENSQYEQYYQKEIYGTDLATLMNKVVDSNINNEVEKNENGVYIDNGKNSIRIDIQFTDDDSIHTLEEIYNSDTGVFVQYYNQIKFKCTKIEYHEQTGKVSYLYFEQIDT